MTHLDAHLKTTAKAYTSMRVRGGAPNLQQEWHRSLDAAKIYAALEKPKLSLGGYIAIYRKNAEDEWVLTKTVAYEPPAPKKKPRTPAATRARGNLRAVK